MPDSTPTAGAPPTPGAAVHPLDPGHDEEAATILAAATGAGTPAAGRVVVDEARTGASREIYGMTVGDELVAVYATRKDGMAVEVTHLAVGERHRRRGHGRACLQDAFRRAGKRPLVVETDDDALGFYTACGFKLIGKRRHPSGVVRYRLGWHAPAAHSRGPLTGVTTRSGTEDGR